MRKSLILSLIGLCALAAPASSQICDLIVLDTVPAPGSLTSPVIVGSTVYVAAGTGGIVSIDISLPDQLSVLGYETSSGQAHDMVLEYFRDLLVVADGSQGVATFSINGDGTVSHIVNTVLGETAVSITGASDQFFVGSQEGTLYAVSLDANNVPVLQGSLSLGGQVLDIVEKSGLAYCALGNRQEIAVVDISDPSSINLLDTINVGGDALSITRSGSQILCGVETQGLLTFAISDETLVAGESLTLSSAPTDIFAWDDRIYVASPDQGVLVIDASLGGGLLQMAELELPDSDALALYGDDIFVARREQGFSAVDASACANTGGNQTTWFVPASARAVGSSNSFWVTDLAIANFTPGVATFNIAYLQKDSDNSSPLNSSMAIGSGQQILINDIFDSLFGLESGNGALRIITSGVDVKITSRTYNTAGLEGTYGQFIPALTANDSLEPGVDGVVLQLQQNDAFRTNLGLVNLTALEVDVEVRLYSGDGVIYGVVDPVITKLIPYEMIQISKVFDKVNAGTVDSGYAVVKVVSAGGKVLSYASVVDEGSNDPIYIPTQSLVASFAK